MLKYGGFDCHSAKIALWNKTQVNIMAEKRETKKSGYFSPKYINLIKTVIEFPSDAKSEEHNIHGQSFSM